MNSDYVTSIPRKETRPAESRRPTRALAVQLMGPLTVLAGLVWAVAQPYRIVFIDRAGHGLEDYLVQPPLLVVAVGLLFTFLVAPGLVEDLEQEADAPAR